MRFLFSIFFSLLLILSSCLNKPAPPDESTLISIQIIDRNGFSETISTKDRLSRYQTTDFKEPQPYQKVFRVFGKNKEGRTPSTITSYHSNGHLWQYLEVFDGRAHGTYQEWHPNGQPKMKLQVIEGISELSETAFASWVFEGINSIWDENGKLIASLSYDKGMLHGNSYYYYPDGNLKKQIPYSQDEIHGDFLTYHENGELEEKISYVYGQRQGPAKAFFKDGSICYEEFFENDLLKTGSYHSEKGAIISSIAGGQGKRPEWEEGFLKRFVSYREGKPDGLVECLDKNGFLQASYLLKEGKKQGEEWEYYPKKSAEDPLQPKLLVHWQEDILQGIVKTWFPTGVQESQKEMYQNKKNGLFFAWYTNGDLMLSEEYEKDLLTSGTYYKKGDKKPVSRILQGKGIATLYNVDGYLLQKVSYDKGLPLLEKDSN
jgi:antitoxin component YwqK of YwqJK toxin-antitoxin module